MSCCLKIKINIVVGNFKIRMSASDVLNQKKNQLLDLVVISMPDVSLIFNKPLLPNSIIKLELINQSSVSSI